MVRSVNSRLVGAVSCLAVLAALVALDRARAQPAPSSRPNFSHLFPQRTGNNGYEEFVLADDLELSSAAWQACDRSAEEPSVETMRAVLADGAVVRALSLLHAGLQKPIRSPRTRPLLQTLVPELASFRSLGRLLCLRMRLSMIDGDLATALSCFEDGLKFGRDVQVGTLASGVVGLYIENAILRTLSGHLESLTDDQCARLIRIVRSHIDPPDPQLGLVRAEKEMYIRTFNEGRTAPAALLDELDPGPGASVSQREDFSSVSKMVHQEPGRGNELLTQATEIVRAHYDRTSAELKKPLVTRNFPGPEDRTSPGAKLVFSVCPPTYARLSDRFGSEQALAQMIAVQAAVSSYRGHRSRLPKGLNSLSLGRLSVDPFTGKPFEYHPLGSDAYEIRSAGGFDPGDRRHPPSGKRIPIVFTYPQPSVSPPANVLPVPRLR